MCLGDDNGEMSDVLCKWDVLAGWEVAYSQWQGVKGDDIPSHLFVWFSDFFLCKHRAETDTIHCIKIKVGILV